MKITDLRQSVSRPAILARDIPIGTVFSGKLYDCGGIFLRINSSVVHLDMPDHLPCCGSLESVSVSDYQPLDAELIVRAREGGER